MGTLLLLMPGEPALGAGTTSALARVGVSRVVILGGEGDSVAVLVEGWALDPVRSGREIRDAIGAAARSSTLLPIAEISVPVGAADASTEGRRP